MKKTIEKGISLIEILVVVTIFAVLGIITTRAVLLTLQGSKKSESLIKIRENLGYSMSIIERQLRNADSIQVCPNPDPKTISYKDQTGNASTFTCNGINTTGGYVASGSARLTSSEVNITSCSFTCDDSTPPNPASVTITLEAQDSGAVGIQNSKVSTTTQIFLRNY